MLCGYQHSFFFVQKKSPKNAWWIPTQRFFVKIITKKRCVDNNTAVFLSKKNHQKTLGGYQHSVYFAQIKITKKRCVEKNTAFFVEKKSLKTAMWIKTPRLFCPNKNHRKTPSGYNHSFFWSKKNHQKTLFGYQHSVYFVQKNHQKTLCGNQHSVFFVHKKFPKNAV